ncbi:hypothetical protein VT25_03565 [Photobacterium leiognathi subsp. mandapamensis]|nr:hypothetical protein VT25_03565 [Photobacterium leiognathi subsp. mandapamensis]
MKSELKEFRALVDAVINSSSKAEAKPYISKMNFAASYLHDKADGYTSEKIRKVCNYASLASGQPRDKEHHISNLERAWYLVESELFAKFSE